VFVRCNGGLDSFGYLSASGHGPNVTATSTGSEGSSSDGQLISIRKRVGSGGFA